MAKKKIKYLTLEQIVKIAQDSRKKNGCCEKCQFWKFDGFNQYVCDCELLCNYGGRYTEKLNKILNYKVEVKDDVD